MSQMTPVHCSKSTIMAPMKIGAGDIEEEIGLIGEIEAEGAGLIEGSGLGEMLGLADGLRLLMITGLKLDGPMAEERTDGEGPMDDARLDGTSDEGASEDGLGCTDGLTNTLSELDG